MPSQSTGWGILDVPQDALLTSCLFCGTQFYTHNPRRLYCSERCRRDIQNERRRDERAEAREVREASRWDYDPWEKNDLGDEVTLNALLDATPWEDAPWDAPATGYKMKPVQKKKRKNENWLWLPGVPQ